MAISGSYNYPGLNTSAGYGSAGKVQPWDGTYDLELDPAGYGVDIGVSHHKVHKGELFEAFEYDGDVDIAVPKEYLLQTPAGSDYAHLSFNVEASAELKIELFEDAVITASGSEMSMINNDRNSANTSDVLAFGSASFSASGSILTSRLLNATKGQLKVGGDDRNEEFILKASSNYFIRLTATSDDTRVNTIFSIYSAPIG